MAIVGGQVMVLVTADTLPAQASLGAMNERVAESRGAFSGMLTQIGSFVAGQVIFALMARAMMEVEKQIKDTATKTEEWDTQLQLLQAHLQSTAGMAGWTAKNAIDLANSMSTYTRYNNVAILSVEDLALTFTGISKDIMPLAVSGILDMAQAMNEDTKSASIQLGKALQDPLLGMTALRRIGVNFSSEQKKLVKGWIEHGEKAKAVALILKEINLEFGKSAEMVGNTLGGKLTILNNQFDMIKETIGNAMVPVLSRLLEGLTPLIIAIGQGLPDALKTAGNFFDNLGSIVGRSVNQQRGDMIPAIEDMTKAFNTALAPAIQQTGSWIMNTLIPAVIQLVAWFDSKVLPVLVQVAGVIATDFMPTWQKLATQLLTQVIPPLQQIVGPLLPVLIPLAQALGWVFSNVVGPALGGVITILGTFLNFIAKVIQAIDDLIHGKLNLANAVNSITRTITDPLKQIGIHVPNFAEGGLAPGGLSVVGERGPEIVRLPGGSRVYPTGTGPQGGGRQLQPWVIVLDGRVLARGLLPPMVDEIRQAAAIRYQ